MTHPVSSRQQLARGLLPEDEALGWASDQEGGVGLAGAGTTTPPNDFTHTVGTVSIPVVTVSLPVVTVSLPVGTEPTCSHSEPTCRYRAYL